MSKRPRSITLISWLFIAVGTAGILMSLLGLIDAQGRQHLAESSHEMSDFAIATGSQMLAILCGVFMLRGFNWARWLLAIWMGGHIAIGALHSPFAGITHALLFGVIAYFVFRPEATAYFRSPKASPTNPAATL